MAFRQHLRAHQDARAAAMHVGQMLLQRAFAAGGVAVNARYRHAGEERAELLLQLLRADADRQQMRRAALRALIGQRSLAVAVVAAQLALLLVQGIVTFAALTLRNPAAIMAEQRGRIAATVEKQQHLIIRLQMLAHFADQRGCQPANKLLAFEIHQLLQGRFRIAGALRQVELAIFAAAHVVQRLQRGRRRAHHDRDILFARAEYRQVARLIAPAFLLFIRAVVLFVDNDHARTRQRRKQRRPRADDNGVFALACAQPDGKTLAVVERRVQHVDRRVEALAEASDGLRRQADLRHQHQRLLAARQHIFQHAKIDFGFAGAGDAGQQPGGVVLIFAADSADRHRLIGIEP